MAKRDPQVFDWSCEDGVLKIVGRPEGPMAGERLIFDTNKYPEDVRGNIYDAGAKAIYQQRSSQVETDEEKMAYWQGLHEMFLAGTWEREGGVRGAPIVGAWVEVMADLKKVSVAVIQTSLAGYDKETRDGIRKNVETKYADKIALKKMERKTVDLEDL